MREKQLKEIYRQVFFHLYKQVTETEGESRVLNWKTNNGNANIIQRMAMVLTVQAPVTEQLHYTQDCVICFSLMLSASVNCIYSSK